MDLDFKDPELHGQVTSGFVSKHLGTNQKFNEDNYGVGYVSPDGWAGGVYKNSLGKNSAYLTKELSTALGKLGPLDFQALVNLGLVTGYNKSVTPVALPGVQANYGDYGAMLGIVPPVKGVTPATLALQLRKQF